MPTTVGVIIKGIIMAVKAIGAPSFDEGRHLHRILGPTRIKPSSQSQCLLVVTGMTNSEKGHKGDGKHAGIITGIHKCSTAVGDEWLRNA